MMGPNSLVDLYKFAVNLFDDPKRSLNVLLLTEIFSWASFQYKSELLEIIDSVGNDRIGEKMVSAGIVVADEILSLIVLKGQLLLLKVA